METKYGWNEDLEILALLSEGYSIVEAAARLTMNPKTVYSRIARMREEFGARNTVELVGIAVRRRWIA